MSSPNPRLISGGTEAGAFDVCETTPQITDSGTHLWLVVITVLFALTLAVEVLDLILWVGRGSRYGLSFLCWTPAIVRVALLTALAGAASYFFRRAGDLKRANQALTQDLDSQMRTLDEKNAQLSRLRQLSEAFISQIDLKAALDLALEMAIDVIGARTASIMLLDPEEGDLRIAAARGLPEQIVRTVRVKPGEGLAGLVAQDGEAIVIDSDRLDERLAPLAQRTHEIRSAIIVPIKLDGKVRGVINVSDKQNGERWCEEDLSVISALAGQVAMALQKIELYQNLQKQVVMLEDALDKLKKTQAELIQSEKLASIGQLAGGVAHEINNPLLVILGRTEFALDRIGPDDPLAKDLEIIRTQTERLAKIVRSLLSFARTNEVDDFGPVAVNDVIENALALTELRAFKENVEVIRALNADLPPVWGNAGQLQQVFVNITINACQAMSDGGGTLTVSTWAKGNSVFAEFRDTGPGISLEDRDKIFEPFFTTKDEMEGTGLGLTICRSIIHAHGGRIEAGGGPGKGAVFTVELAAAKANAPVREVGAV